VQANAPVIPLKFRPQDPNCHPTYGARHKARCLVVKLTRRQGGEPEYTAQVVACVNTAYR
jgi:hypothetical protein